VLLVSEADDGHRLVTLEAGVPLGRDPVEAFLRETGVLR
jgi:hypothetical protein